MPIDLSLMRIIKKSMYEIFLERYMPNNSYWSFYQKKTYVSKNKKKDNSMHERNAYVALDWR